MVLSILSLLHNHVFPRFKKNVGFLHILYSLSSIRYTCKMFTFAT